LWPRRPHPHQRHPNPALPVVVMMPRPPRRYCRGGGASLTASVPTPTRSPAPRRRRLHRPPFRSPPCASACAWRPSVSFICSARARIITAAALALVVALVVVAEVAMLEPHRPHCLPVRLPARRPLNRPLNHPSPSLHWCNATWPRCCPRIRAQCSRQCMRMRVEVAEVEVEEEVEVEVEAMCRC
jgi:hypothetical protein